jgi:hypothetical protein
VSEKSCPAAQASGLCVRRLAGRNGKTGGNQFERPFSKHCSPPFWLAGRLSCVLDRKRSPTFDYMDTAKVELQMIREIRLVTPAATV